MTAIRAPVQRGDPGSFNVRVGHDLHLAASVAATRHRISLNDLTRKALSEYLEQHA